MNRRDFFKFAGATSLIALPVTTYFLAPRGGWHPHVLADGYMRECEQYLINTDEFAFRYDAAGQDIWGAEYQFHVDSKYPSVEQARLLIADRFQKDGLRAIKPMQGSYFKLELPRTFIKARYV